METVLGEAPFDRSRYARFVLTPSGLRVRVVREGGEPLSDQALAPTLDAVQKVMDATLAVRDRIFGDGDDGGLYMLDTDGSVTRASPDRLQGLARRIVKAAWPAKKAATRGSSRVATSSVRASEAWPRELPREAPPPPRAPKRGTVRWHRGREVGTSYATRGPVQVTVELDLVSRMKRTEPKASRPEATYRTVLRAHAIGRPVVFRYVYADGVTRAEAKAVADRALLGTVTPIRVQVEQAPRTHLSPNAERQFGLFGTYDVPINTRSRLNLEPEVYRE